MILNTIALVVLAAAAFAGLTVLRRRIELARLNVDPVCAECDTPAETLVTFACPGCGKDVREKGLSVPFGRSPLAVFWRAIAATLLVVMLGVLTWVVLSTALPGVRIIRASGGIDVGADRIEMFASVRHYLGRSSGVIVLQLRLANGGVSVMEIDAATRTSRILLPDGRSKPGDLRIGWLERWYNDAGISAIPIDNLSELDRITRAIDQLLEGLEIVGASPWGGSSMATPPEWLIASIVGACSLLWVALILLVTRNVVADDDAVEPA